MTLDGRRVGVVGTGSTAVQIVVGDRRPRGEALAVPAHARSGSCRRRTRATARRSAPSSGAIPELRRPRCTPTWRSSSRAFSNGLVDANSPQMKMIEDACRANLEQNVRDPVLREKLRPSYRAACKRLVMSPDFYRAIQQPQRRGRDRGHRARRGAGRAHARRAPARARRAGARDRLPRRPLHAPDRGRRARRPRASTRSWAKRPSAYLSISIPGFPNLFMLNGPNGPVGNFSLIEVAELQLGYVLAARRAAAQRALPRDQPERGGDAAPRGRAHRGRAPHDLGHRLPQLVPRRPRRPDELALDLRALPRGDGGAEARGVRAALRLRRQPGCAR